MKVGVGVGVVRLTGDTRPLTTLYAESVEEAIRAESEGYDFVGVHEHHFEDGWSNPSPLIVLAAIATRTTTIQLGTTVLLPALYHPVRLAEDIATVDLLSGGRFSLCAMATGSGSAELRAYGIDPSERFGRVFETAAIVRSAFEFDRYDHSGHYFNFPGLELTTKPVLEPFPLWITALGPKTMGLAGRQGYHSMTTIESMWYLEQHEAGLVEAGHDPARFNACATGVRAVVLRTRRESAQCRGALKRIARASTLRYLATRDLLSEGRTRAVQEWERRGEEPGRFRGGLVGTPDEILAELEPVLKNSKITHLKVECSTTGGPESKQLWLDEVVPVLRTWGRAPVSAQVDGR